MLYVMIRVHPSCEGVAIYCFFFNDTATTEIYTLSLHDALPISRKARTEKEAHGEFESECPGYCGAQDTFCVGTMKRVARVERLTSDAGAVIVREVMERSGIIEWLTERLHDPRQLHLVTCPLADLLRTMLLLFAQGWRDQDDADALRLDPALRQIGRAHV